MKLLDSNILIYSYSDSYDFLRSLVLEEVAFISEITRLEVMGFYGLTEEESCYFTDIFSELKSIEINTVILDEAIKLRRTHKMKLGDSIIAATALVNKFELYTRNEHDFQKIPKLMIINPVDV